MHRRNASDELLLKGDSRVPFASAIVLASGTLALMHQLLWTRRLVDLLGGSAESSTRVFGCFFLGLSLGAALAAFLASRVTSP